MEAFKRFVESAVVEQSIPSWASFAARQNRV
jgi:hypothetical protein